MDAIKESYFGWSISRSAVAGTELISVVATSLPDGVQVELAPESFSHPPQSAVGGVLCHAVLSESRWSRLNSVVQYRSSDILIVSYPKCGTTWLEQCVLLLLNGGDKALLNPGNKNVYSPLMPDRGGKIWLEACIHEDPQAIKAGEEFRPVTLEEFNLMAAPRVIKTHVPCKLLLGMNGCTDIVPGVKIIIISRNPLDACVSRYYHAFNPYKCGWPFPAWAAVWLSGNSGYGSWFTWVRDWYEAAKANSDQVLWIQYEDMQKNSYDEIEKIRKFLNIQNDVADNFDLIRKVAEGCSFDSMKEQSLQTEITGDFQGHLRKGVTGDWRNHFTPEMKKEFDDIYGREMSGSGLVYDFGEN